MPELKVYDTHFNLNEWAVLIGLGIGVVVVFLLPRRFTRKLSILYFVCGAVFGASYDFTLGAIPTSFYDIGDNSNYDFMDILSIFAYGPYGYLFFYIYDRFQIKPRYSPLYILGWTMLSMVLEWGGEKIGVYHYNEGYGIGISLEIYLVVHMCWMLFYYVIRRFDDSPAKTGSQTS